MKKQLQDFKDERDTLKSSVHRMTAELSRYQAKYRTPPAGEVRLGTVRVLRDWSLITGRGGGGGELQNGSFTPTKI